MRVLFHANGLRNFLYPNRSTSITHQCNRSIHLLYTAKRGRTRPKATQKDLVGFDDIHDYVKADFLEALCERRLELWDENPRTIIEPEIDLRSVLEKYITPGICLAPFFGESEKGAENSTSIPQYKLVSLNTEPLPKYLYKGISARKPSQVGVEIHMTPGKYTYFLLCMQKAFDMLRNSSDVEFHIRYKARGTGKESVIPNHYTLREVLGDNLHFHPKAILKAMPESSGIIVNPKTNLTELCWAIGPPVKLEGGGHVVPGNITKSLWMRREGIHWMRFRDKLDAADMPNFRTLFRK